MPKTESKKKKSGSSLSTTRKKTAQKKAFLADFQVEFRKIEWPTRPNVIKTSMIILIVTIFFTSWVTALDFMFSEIFVKLKSLNV